MARTKKKAGWINPESTFTTDPDSDGSSALNVPALSIDFPKNGKEQLETDYETGRNFPTAAIPGADGGTFSMEVPLGGLTSACGVGVNGSSVTADWLDAILAHIFTTVATTAGLGVGASSTTTNLVMDSDGYGIQDLLPIFEALLPASNAVRSQWTKVTVDPATGQYTVAPAFVTAPTTAAIAYGTKYYLPSDNGGPTFTFDYLEDDIVYSMTGCRITSAKIMVPARKMCTMQLGISYDGALNTTSAKVSLPTPLRAPVVTPLIGLLSPIWFNGTAYQTPMVELDLGISAAEQLGTDGPNGRSGHDSIHLWPSLTVHPLRTDAIRNLQRNATYGPLLMQIGGGPVAGGVLNSMCFEMAESQAKVVDAEDESGRIRQTLKIGLSDMVTFSGTTASRAFQLARA